VIADVSARLRLESAAVFTVSVSAGATTLAWTPCRTLSPAAETAAEAGWSAHAAARRRTSGNGTALRKRGICMMS
jgi:hypothetical protein